MLRYNLYFQNLKINSSLGLIWAAFLTISGISRKKNFKHKRRLEIFLKSEIKCIDTIAVPSGRSGLFALLSALKLEKGDEVIVTGFTCSAVVDPIVQLGAVPVFIDIDIRNFSMDHTKLISEIRSRTRVIILQHTFGFPGSIDAIMEISRTFNLFVIEDCSLALGCKRNGRWLGTFGDAALWSFELSKTISVGWGGLVGLNSDMEIALQVREILENEGFQGRILSAKRLFQGGLSGILYNCNSPMILRKYLLMALFRSKIFISSSDTPSTDLRLPSDLQWKYLYLQIINLDSILINSKLVQDAYDNVLIGHGCVSISSIIRNNEVSLIRFPVIVKNIKRCIDFFAIRDIEVGRWFNSPISLVQSKNETHLQFGYKDGLCPISELVCEHIVNLPLHGLFKKSQIEIVTKTLDEYLTLYPEETEFILAHSCLN